MIDLNGPMLEYTGRRRLQEPAFTLSPDGVHPQLIGHVIMAREALRRFGIALDHVDPAVVAARLENDDLFRRVHERRAMRSAAWLVEIGYDMPMELHALPIAEAEARAASEKREILDALRKRAVH